MSRFARSTAFVDEDRDDLRWLERIASRVTIGVYVALLVLGALTVLLRSGSVDQTNDEARACAPVLR